MQVTDEGSLGILALEPHENRVPSSTESSSHRDMGSRTVSLLWSAQNSQR